MPGRIHDPSSHHRDAAGQTGGTERIYDYVLASISEGVVVHDRSGRIVSCNPAAERILERSSDQILSLDSADPSWRTIHEDGTPFPGAEHPAAVTLRTGQAQRGVTMGLVRPGRKPTWISINSEPIVHESETLAVAVSFTDVTQAMQAARELRRRNRELILLNRIIAHCTAAEDPDQLLSAVCDQLAAKLGFEAVLLERAEALDVPHAVTTTGHSVSVPIDAPGFGCASLRLVPGEGNAVGPSRLRSVRMVVEQVESALTRIQLARQNREVQKMEALGRLAGGIAHDFNNLLTAIQGHASLGLAANDGNDATRLHLAGIQETGRRAAHLTGKLLTFVRGRVTSNEALQLNEALREMHDLLRRLLPEHVRLNLHLAPDLGWTRADPTDFEQIVINLVVNAVDAMPDGGRIDIQTENREQDGGQWIALRVLDEGIGIQPDSLQRIFEPLFTTKAQDRGTGIGLATVHSIVQADGGRVHVESQVGVGTTFEVLLPRIDPPGSQPGEILFGELQPGDGRTVLLVEDDLYLRPLLLRTFKDAGYAVLAAARDGEAALRAMHDMEHLEVGLDLVVSDVVLPRLDGRAVVDAMRERFPDVAAILMSGYPGDIARRVLHLPPRTAFIEKPFEPAEILRLAARLVRHGDGG